MMIKGSLLFSNITAKHFEAKNCNFSNYARVIGPLPVRISQLQAV